MAKRASRTQGIHWLVANLSRVTSTWQTIPNNDSGASGLAYAGDGIFLLVNEDGFWEVGQEPLRAQRVDFAIEGALELEAICAVPSKAGQFMVLEKNSGRVTLIVREAPGVIRQLSQFVVPKLEGEILECLDCFTLSGQSLLAYGHRGGGTRAGCIGHPSRMGFWEPSRQSGGDGAF
jgi:hypothetical protein